MGVSSAGRVDRSRDSEPMSGFFAVCCQCCNHQVLSHGAAGPWQVVTLLTGSNQQSFDGGRRRQNVCDTKSQCYAKDNRTAFNCTQ